MERFVYFIYYYLHLKKIKGKIRNRKWEDKEGITRYKNEILADNMTMLGSRPSTEKSNDISFPKEMEQKT